MSFRSIQRTVLLGLMSATFLSAPIFAQDDVDLDRKKIEEAVREAQGETAAFAAEVAARAEAYSDEVYALREQVVDQIAAGEHSDFDPNDLTSVKGLAPSIAAQETEAPEAIGVFVFASFGMPKEALRQLVRDAHDAEVPVVLRGFHGDSLGDTARAMHDLIGDTGTEEAQPEIMGGVIIDPRAFRVFQIEHVPAFVSTASPLPDCDGLDCSATPPPHDRISGNLTLRGALQLLATKGEEAPNQARAALHRMEEDT